MLGGRHCERSGGDDGRYPDVSFGGGGGDDGGEGEDNDNDEDLHRGGQGCVGRCGGGRALAAAAFTVTKLDRHPGGRTNDVTHPIRGNNQLMMIVGGGEDKRGGQLWGIG